MRGRSIKNNHHVTHVVIAQSKPHKAALCFSPEIRVKGSKTSYSA